MFKTNTLLRFILSTDLLELNKYIGKSMNVSTQHNCILKLSNPCIVVGKVVSYTAHKFIMTFASMRINTLQNSSSLYASTSLLFFFA